MNKHSNSTLLKCSTCHYTCYNEGTLRNHQHLRHRNIRSEEVESELGIKKISEKVQKNGVDLLKQRLSCSFCSYYTDKSSKLKRHVVSVHDRTKSLKCVYCEACFTRADNLKAHCNRKHGIGSAEQTPRFQCQICCKFFQRKSHLTEHTQTHSAEKNVLCEVCGGKFKSESSLRKHKRTFHAPNGVSDSHDCSVCKKSFKTSYALTRHLKTRTHQFIDGSTPDITSDNMTLENGFSNSLSEFS